MDIVTRFKKNNKNAKFIKNYKNLEVVDSHDLLSFAVSRLIRKTNILRCV